MYVCIYIYIYTCADTHTYTYNINVFIPIPSVRASPFPAECYDSLLQFSSCLTECNNVSCWYVNCLEALNLREQKSLCHVLAGSEFVHILCGKTARQVRKRSFKPFTGKTKEDIAEAINEPAADDFFVIQLSCCTSYFSPTEARRRKQLLGPELVSDVGISWSKRPSWQHAFLLR